MTSKKHSAGPGAHIPSAAEKAAAAPTTGATPEASSGTADDSAQDEPRRALFEPFEWHQVTPGEFALNGQRLANFAGSVQDVALGVQSVMQIIEMDEIDGLCADDEGKTLPALLPGNVAGHLQRLCIAALGMLANEAEGVLGYINGRAPKRGAA